MQTGRFKLKKLKPYLVLSGAVLLLSVLGSAQAARARALKADVVLIPDPIAEQIGGEVSFFLPKKVRIGDTTYKICQTQKDLCGRMHTCTLRPEDSQAPNTTGNIKILIRAAQGSKIGGVFVGAVTAGAGTLLMTAGCDGDPSVVDDFQGDVAALFAEVAIIAAQSMDSNHGHPEGISIKDELKSRFQIDACRDDVDFKLLDFHGFTIKNRGGSATGLGSAKVKLIFRKTC